MKLAKLAPLAALVFVIAAMSGRAVAYFAGGGQGNGAAAVAPFEPLAPLTIPSPNSAVVEPLYPGGSGDLVIAIQNPNTFPIGVASIDVLPASETSSVFGCKEFLEVTGATFDTVERLAPGEAVDLTITDGATLLEGAPDVCQGATFGVSVVVHIVTVPA